MLYNLLASGQDSFRKLGAGEAALYAAIGFAVVFLGILFLILVVWGMGKIIAAVEGKAVTQKEKKKSKEPILEKEAFATEKVEPASVDEVDEETVAVITAAIMAYYQKNNPKCEFTVRRIKRI